MYGALKSYEAIPLGDKLESAWNYEISNKKEPSLWRAILKVFKKEIFLYGIYNCFIELVVRLSQPLLLTQLLKYYEPNQTAVTRNEAYLYSGLIIAASLLNVLCIHTYMYFVLLLGMKLRVAACSLIYRKALKLSNTALAETTIGQMVNLLSNDVSRFDFAMIHFHGLWVAPIETIIVMVLIYINVGPTGLVGPVFLLLFIPFEMYMGKKTSEYRFKTAVRTDERVRLMNEIISGIQVIKMYTWEKPFAKLVQITRMKEMKQIRATSIIRAFTMSCNLMLQTVATFLCIITYVLTGNTVNASFVYTVTSFYGLLKFVVIMLFPQAVTQFAETNVSVRRIREFLLYDEIHKIDNVQYQEKYENGTNGTLWINKKDKAVGIHMKNASVKWIQSSPENTLENINFDGSSNELIAVVGTVGGGKTTLLHAILKELPVQDGLIDVQGVISYASQEPWLFGGSVRQNIVFGQDFDQKKYEEVVRVCALQRDFTLFPHGDRTLVGDRGVTLSGGQRARINLARAIYKEADIYLLDDPLSAVDTHVGKQLFDNCVCGYLKDKCVILVTHQIQYLRNVNKIYLLEKGRITASGTYSELKTTETEFTKLLTDSAEQEEEENNSKRKSKLLNQKEDNDDQEAPTLEKEERGSGIISWSVYKSYLKAGGSWFKTILLCLAFIVSQAVASLTDYFISVWSNIEQWRNEHSVSGALENGTDLNPTINVTAGSELTSQYFLSDILTERNCTIIYTSLVCLTVVLTVTRSISFFRYCMTASTNLHNKMFEKIVYATMRFFNTNPPGRILNRFSKDIGAVDEMLPLTIVDTVQIGIIVLGISIVVGSLNPWIFLPTVIILVIFYLIRIVFLATSRDIKRVEAVTRSPIYTHLSASLQGLTTIRAFGAQEVLKVEFDNYQDKYSAAYFMFLCANRTFGFWLDIHCVIYTALVIVSILFIESEIFAGNVGLALTQSIGLMGMFQWGMRQWSELENQMTSVERIQEYTNITPEADKKSIDPPKLWPEKGEIKFVKLCLRYSPYDPYVLKDLTFEIKPKEKVGIVGRTGAGKSSLIVALFRLSETDGTIRIDNVNTKEVPLNVLRSKLSIIPQEPVLFSGTLRKNLDPFDEYNDEVLWNALDEVELKKAISELSAGLDSRISEGGSNFSVGQRQLLCLARAVIRNNKILVMDEATANVDPHTDGLIQSTIRRKFADCTVLTIAHRLHTIMDSDKVLVMDSGRVAEFDHPHTLLQNASGVFTGLVMQTGKAMAENLMSIAEQNFRSSLAN
ncbi:probable multidrug resistance-associated protein lethal(2)03659 [Anoplophora glabripennis]|nr:probable multidrug resistance-associated protein lethal(2)03659 [Anoplophora glabripennis]